MNDSRFETLDGTREPRNDDGLRDWLLIRSNRLAFAGALALFVFTGYISFNIMLEPTLQSEITSTDTIETIFSTMIQVLVTGTILVVTISQLVLSQEDGPLGDQRQRMSDAMDFRTYMSELIEDVVPNQPSAFLGRLVAETDRRAEALDQLAADADDQDYRDAVSTVVESIQSEAQAAEEDLFSGEFGTFDLLNAALDFDYSEKIYQLERLEHEYPTAAENPHAIALQDLQTAVAMFGPAREHVKTLYFQWELVDLSWYILGIAVVALVIAGGMLTFVGAETFGQARFLRIPVITWVVGVAFTISLTPFLLFASYIVRIVLVAKQTLAIGPFNLQ